MRDGLNLSLLPGGRWPQQLSSLFRARLVETFQNGGLARSLAGDGARADYELDLDIRAFELDAPTSQVNIDIAARIVALNSGRVADVEIFTMREPVASTDAAAVAAALDSASSRVMTKIVAVRRRAAVAHRGDRGCRRDRPSGERRAPTRTRRQRVNALGGPSGKRI